MNSRPGGRSYSHPVQRGLVNHEAPPRVPKRQRALTGSQRPSMDQEASLLDMALQAEVTIRLGAAANLGA